MADSMPPSTVTLALSAACPSHSRADITVRDTGFSIDEPSARGGTNAGPTPTDTALAALAGCTNVIAHKCAKRLKVDIGELDIEVSCEFDRRGVTLAEEIDVPFRSVTLTVRAHGSATSADLGRVAAETKKYCPLSKLFSSAGSEVIERWSTV